MARIYYNSKADVELCEDTYNLYGNPYVVKYHGRPVISFDEKCEANRYYNWLVNNTLQHMK